MITIKFKINMPLILKSIICNQFFSALLQNCKNQNIILNILKCKNLKWRKFAHLATSFKNYVLLQEKTYNCQVFVHHKSVSDIVKAFFNLSGFKFYKMKPRIFINFNNRPVLNFDPTFHTSL